MTVEAAVSNKLRTPTPFNDSRGRYYFIYQDAYAV